MTSFCVVDQAVNMMKHVETYINVGMELAIDVASDLGEYEKGDCEEELNEVMLDYIRMQRDFKQFIDSVEYMKKKVGANFKTAEVVKMESILHERVAELKSTNDDSLFKEHEKYRDLVEKIHEVRNTDQINTETRAITQGEEDEDVQMTEDNVVTKCPYTAQEMTNPVKNKICGHNYEKDGILEYISNRKHKAK
ncbi:hypothetical protein LOTGIDRAFT_129800 [Lottia gigantea]|uniref:E3 SUMO-protein ligase NSE2 n=1 Tax=Lottia gigantea TaxID=225164 RepID=V3Z5G5_LOTGI|nr:hypothetical protein LOTGIDRAFT_129800 [Lottia gigantea]ESO85988.1 hypothetical protein LOTGIDRAFT_129800 [Lottia gigantea]